MYPSTCFANLYYNNWFGKNWIKVIIDIIEVLWYLISMSSAMSFARFCSNWIRELKGHSIVADISLVFYSFEQNCIALIQRCFVLRLIKLGLLCKKRLTDGGQHSSEISIQVNFLKRKKLNALYHDDLQVKKIPFSTFMLVISPLMRYVRCSRQLQVFFQGTPYWEFCRVWYVHEGMSGWWLIDCLGFYAVSAIDQPFNGGDF